MAHLTSALLAALRLLEAVLIPDLAPAGLVATVTAVAALAVFGALVAMATTLPRTGESMAAPGVDGIRAPRQPRPTWARADAPGKRLPRAPGIVSAA